jgi:tRNA threonylcarbamoyladenosine biosynthesis protein TsaB
MKILALETSGQSGSVALFDGKTIVGELSFPLDERNAKTLAPAVQELLGSAGWRPSEIRLVAVAVGPGSFTGLRIGVTTAKTFAYAVRAEVIGVNTLEVIAAQAPPDVNRLAVVLDAQRQQVFAAEFARGSAGDFECVSDTAIVDNGIWLAKLDQSVAVSGPAIEKLGARLPAGIVVVARECWTPRAATVGDLGWRLHQVGQRDDLWRLVPQYFRRSAAEEKLEQKVRGEG